MTKNKTELGDLINDVMTDLIDYADDAIQDERDDAYAAGYKQGRFDAEIDAFIGGATVTPARDFLEESRRDTHPTESELTPQERRDEVVEQAKEDVKELTERMSAKRINFLGEGWFRHGRTYPEFIVNREKRTVVMLARGIISDRVMARGIAKCAPDDCFNEHIGKAIALHRAIGFDVPDDYIFTPQPTEERVGDVVMSTCEERPEWGNGVVKKLDSEKSHPVGYFVEDGSCAYTREAKIIDDSREGE